MGAMLDFFPATKGCVGGVASPKSKPAIAYRLPADGPGLDDTSCTSQSNSWYLVTSVELWPRSTTPRTSGHVAIGSNHASLYRSIASLLTGSGTPLENSSLFTIWLARKESVDRSIELVAAFEEVEFKYEDIA